MTILSVSGLALQFGTKSVFDNISFSLNEGDKMGLVGINGCGKTSLFKTIIGEYDATSGDIYKAKDKIIGYLAQDTLTDDLTHSKDTALQYMYHAFPELLDLEEEIASMETRMEQGENLSGAFAVLHEMYVAKGGLEFRQRCSSILLKLGFDETMQQLPVNTLSGGQHTRLALGRRLCREPDILLLDEPTNHLDIETLEWLESYLSQWKKTLLIISHDRFFLDKITNKTLMMEYGHAKLYLGNYTIALLTAQKDKEIQEHQYEQQQKEIAHHEAVIEQQRRWGQEHNFVTLRARQKILDRIDRIEKPKEAPSPIKMQFHSALNSGNDVLTVKHLTMGFTEHPLFSDISFLLKKNDRAFIIGPNGCGKSTLIKLLLGQLTPLSGKIEAGYNVQVGYYDQENQNLSPENTVLEELWSAYPHKTETEIRTALAQFRFIGEDVFQSIPVLSGGQRARLTMAKLILSPMNLLILDEPTNHLDVDSREVLESALNLFQGTILIVSHDRYLIEKLATRILELCPGRDFPNDFADYQVSHVGAGYTEYMAFKAKRHETVTPIIDNCVGQTISPISSNKEQYLKNKQQIQEERRRVNRLAKIKDLCGKLETELGMVETELYGEAATDYQKATELDKRRAEIEEQLLALYEENETLEHSALDNPS